MLSIIVPVYNTEKYLGECIESILNQTYRDFELLLVDDGSTDKSLEICIGYKRKDSRIKVFHRENSGVSAARNYGLESAQGEFISFCDSDDVIKPKLYEILFDKMIYYGVDRVCGGYEYLYPDGHCLYCKGRKADGLYKKEDLLPVMIDDGTLSGFLFSGVYNSIFKREIIEKKNIRFNEMIKYNEDSLFSFEYAMCSENLYCLQSQALYLYRQHELSSTRKRKKGDKYSVLHNKLAELCSGYKNIDFEMQMKRRSVTVALWEILDIADKEKGLEAVNDIKNILRQSNLANNINFLDVSHMNCYKKIYRIMMKHNMAWTLYFISKRLLPFLSKHLSR